MQYKEEQGDLFELDSSQWKFVQCISADFAMGAGIALQFNKQFNVKQLLVAKFGNFLHYWDDPEEERKGWCVYANNVYNLITKRYYWHKPTKSSIRNALLEMKQMCIQAEVKNLAMPKIACGLDQMNWIDISTMIQDIFQDTEINILVRYN